MASRATSERLCARYSYFAFNILSKVEIIIILFYGGINRYHEKSYELPVFPSGKGRRPKLSVKTFLYFITLSLLPS